jgi:anthranilate phosphoribosyltransferase
MTGARSEFSLQQSHLQHILRQLVDGRHLTLAEAGATMGALMDGAATPAQIGALLMALRMKGETVTEVAGFAAQMRARVVPVPARRHPLLDTCGTGGSVCRVFNVSTAAAFVAAAADIAVAKHGNRAMTGVCGSADVLEALGVRIDLPPAQCAACIDEVGIGFLFAPAHHPATRHVSGPRRELGVRTIFNLLGPLSNPAGATRQVMGVYDGALCSLAAGALRELGSDRAIVVHGEIGLGEIATIGRTRYSELRDGEIMHGTLVPQDLGLYGPEPHAADLAPAPTAAANAALLRAVLAGKDADSATRARRDLVAVNAAAALRIAGRLDDQMDNRGEAWPAAVELAQEIISSGTALARLEQLATFTQDMIP